MGTGELSRPMRLELLCEEDIETDGGAVCPPLMFMAPTLGCGLSSFGDPSLRASCCCFAFPDLGRPIRLLGL